jgi:hypothetical protein
MIEIREEHPADVAAIRDVNASVFGQNLEANIVDALRSNGAILLSLVAILQGRVVGHIMYSPASIGSTMGAALGPMAVLPAHQRDTGLSFQTFRCANSLLFSTRIWGQIREVDQYRNGRNWISPREAHDARDAQTLDHPPGADIRDGLRHSTGDRD